MGIKSNNPSESYFNFFGNSGKDAVAPSPVHIAVEYLVIAGGGGGGYGNGGGGGAGGYRTNYTSSAPVSTPKVSGGGGAVESAYTVELSSSIPLYIGDGGTAGSQPAGNVNSADGGDSKFGDITSVGGGAGGNNGQSGGNTGG